MGVVLDSVCRTDMGMDLDRVCRTDMGMVLDRDVLLNAHTEL